MSASTRDAVYAYASGAFSVVLEQHDFPVPSKAVLVTHLFGNYYSLYYHGSMVTALGQFTGSDKGGSVTLGLVQRHNPKTGSTIWTHVFNSSDAFFGVDQYGYPVFSATTTPN